ncbi:MAG: metallophosphoesterase family protein [Candidatus Latescibacterota bacterium]
MRRGVCTCVFTYAASLFLAVSCALAGPDDWPSWGQYSPLKVLQSKPKPAGKWSFIVYGDSKGSSFHKETFIPELLKLNPTLIVNTGDMVARGGGVLSREEDWKPWEEESRELRNRIPFFPVIGNHETTVREPKSPDHNQYYKGMRNFSLFYDLPKESGWEFYYSFVYGNITYVILAIPGADFKPDTVQWQWLEQTLAKATTPHIITFSHSQIYSVGDKEDYIWAHAAELTALLKKYGVKLHFSGNDHIYYRTLRDGVTYVISAGGGAKMYPLNHLSNAIPGDVYFSGDGKPDMENYYYYVALDVDGDTISGKTVLANSGKVADTFTVKARDGKTSN